MMDANEHQVALSDWRRFVLAGRAVFTVRNEHTGNRLTYKVKKAKDTDVWFVSVLAGASYDYVGTIFGDGFRWTHKSAVPRDSVAFRVFAWLYDHILANIELPGFVQVYHEGKCGRCGRPLTVPESIESGFGPECVKFL